MEMLGLLIVLGVVASLLLPWINMFRIGGYRRELERLRSQLREMQDSKDSGVIRAKKSKPEKAPQPVAVSKPEVKESASQGADLQIGTAEPKPQPTIDARQESGDPGNAALPCCTASDKPEQVVAEPAQPQDWFSKIAVWVGGVALLMAGFYMVKFSIDSGWLTPAVRVWLTTIFGVILCVAGFLIGVKSSMVANVRIGQALSGAGVACLYFAAYAAVHLYGFLSSGQGFVAMLVVTLLAVGLSLKNGAPIALMGLVGGFLTPWLMSTGPDDTVMLFSYLFLLFCGAQFLCVRRGWWALLLGSLVGAYIWSGVVIFGNAFVDVHNLEGTLIFVMGICLVNAVWAFMSKLDDLEGTAKKLLLGIRFMTWGGGLIQAVILVIIGGFSAVDMVLFGLLSVGALTLAVLKEKEFLWAAWLSLSAVAVGALSNESASLVSWMLTPFGFMGLFFAVGHWRSIQSSKTLAWRSLSVSSALIIVPLLFINSEFIASQRIRLDGSIWFYLSAIWSVLLGLAGEHIIRRESDREVGGEYSLFAVILLSFGLWNYVPEDYWAHTAAGLLIAASLYWKFREFGKSSLITSLLGLAWGSRMLQLAGEACAYFFREDYYPSVAQNGLAILSWGVGLLGLGVVYACFRGQWSEGSIKLLRRIVGVVALLAFVAGYQWLDESYMPEAWAAVSVEGGLTALLSVAAVGLVVLAGKWPGLRVAGIILAGLAAVRVCFLHLGDAGAEGESFFFNALILQFGLPFVAAFALAWFSQGRGHEIQGRVFQLAALLLGFIWATFLVQDYFGGSHLVDPSNSSTEIYAYSVVWLLLAVAYQAIGLWRNQSAIHVGSLILLLVTIGKVFLVDTSALEGLFRVLSFLGLGLALIGIGFFYNKVVFARREASAPI